MKLIGIGYNYDTFRPTVFLFAIARSDRLRGWILASADKLGIVNLFKSKTKNQDLCHALGIRIH